MEDGDVDLLNENLKEDIELVDCNICGRHFRSDVLAKHEPICIKNSKKKRKVFISGKQRADGSDIPINNILKPGETPKPDPNLAQAEARTKKWREKHNLLVESLRAAREYAKAKSSGAPLPPPPPTIVDSSLVQCPYCQRRFNEESSKRHIAFCKEHQTKTAPRTTVTSTAKKTLSKPLTATVKPESASQRLPVASVNGARPRTVPQSSVPRANTRNDDSKSMKVVKSNVPAKTAVVRSEPSPPLASVTQVRTSTTRIGVTGIGKLSSLPRAPKATIKTSHSAVIVKPVQVSATTSGGFCHECGSAYPVATARFCCDCGVRRL